MVRRWTGDFAAVPLGDSARTVVPSDLAEWQAPQQGELKDDDELRECMARCRPAAKLMTEFCERDGSASDSARVFYVPTSERGTCRLAGLSSSKPPGSSQSGECIACSSTWEVVTPESWERQLLEFALTCGFEIVDLQSDLTVCVSLFVDVTYAAVPMHVKILFAIVTAATVALEVGMAMYQTARSRRRKGEQNTINSEFLMTTVLNYLCVPVELLVAPFRFSHFGAHRLGRNIGSCADQRDPIVLRGDTALVPYLKSRQYIVRIPKVVLENIVLFGLTLYIQDKFIEGWTGAMSFSASLSFISLCGACYKTVMYFRDAHVAKAFLRMLLDNQCVSCQDSARDFANFELNKYPLSCPLL